MTQDMIKPILEWYHKYWITLTANNGATSLFSDHSVHFPLAMCISHWDCVFPGYTYWINTNDCMIFAYRVLFKYLGYFSIHVL